MLPQASQPARFLIVLDGSTSAPEFGRLPKRRVVGALPFEIRKLEYAVDESRTAAKTIGELHRGRTLRAPAQQAPLERPQTVRLLRRAAARKIGEHEDALDELAAAMEAAANLVGDHSRRCQPTDSAFERAQVREVVHEPTLPPPIASSFMAITGVANLAIKVADLDGAVAFYRNAGATVTAPEEWRDGRRADVHLGPLEITLFTRAVYEDAVDLPAEGFLHVALFSDDLARQIEGHDVVWGPAVVSGPTFGRRRIAFVEAPGGMRLELMEQLDDPA
jgi:hypothetical protein